MQITPEKHFQHVKEIARIFCSFACRSISFYYSSGPNFNSHRFLSSVIASWNCRGVFTLPQESVKMNKRLFLSEKTGFFQNRRLLNKQTQLSQERVFPLSSKKTYFFQHLWVISNYLEVWDRSKKKCDGIKIKIYGIMCDRCCLIFY